MAHLYAGTSGFAYAAWKPAFYPAKLPATKFLPYYAERLNSVEINYTFRQFPSAKTLDNWIGATPPGFTFVLKAPMRITHILRLKNTSQIVEAFVNAIQPLRIAGKLGAILFQLPPQFPSDLALLSSFLSDLPRELRYAFEFRHPSWSTPEAYTMLEKHRAALCVAESEKLEVPQVVTTDFAYLRLRKPDYTPEDRRAITARVKKLLGSGKDVFVFFKHEETAEGALYAEELLKSAGAKLTEE